MELQGRLKSLEAKGIGLAGISYDRPEILIAFSRQRGITFPLLSDAGSATIKRYGVLNTLVDEALGPGKDDPIVRADAAQLVSVNPNAGQLGMAFPGTFMLDRQGRVTSRFFENFYRERNTAESIMLKLGAGSAPVSATRISSPNVDITTYPSDTSIAPGEHFSLVFDVMPGPNIHVYAPGASSYRVIALTIEQQPVIRALPMKYPPSEIYVFKPLNERVPVFQKRFTLVQAMVLEGTPAAQAALKGKDSVTVNATLEYQACDDRICFNPVSVPLSWTMILRPLVTERPLESQSR